MIPNIPATIAKMPKRMSRRTIATAPSVMPTIAIAIEGPSERTVSGGSAIQAAIRPNRIPVQEMARVPRGSRATMRAPTPPGAACTLSFFVSALILRPPPSWHRVRVALACA